MRTELIEDEGESRYKITDIIGERESHSTTVLCTFWGGGGGGGAWFD